MTPNNTRAVAGGMAALALLAFYLYLVGSAIAVVHCANQAGCTAFPLTSFNDVKLQALGVVSGLISALIISELAVSKPGATPGIRAALAETVSNRAQNILKWVVWLYILAWFVAGGSAFWVGLSYPSTLPALTSLGQAWFGLAVASSYAYLGLQASQS